MCAGRATYQPTSNGGENLACRKKSVDSRRQQNTAVCSKKKTPEAPRAGREWGTALRADSSSTGSTKSESNLSVSRESELLGEASASSCFACFWSLVAAIMAWRK